MIGCSPSPGCPTAWRSARTTNAIERLHEEFKRRIQDANRAAVGGDGGDAVLGTAGIRSDHHAQGRRMADSRREADHSMH